MAGRNHQVLKHTYRLFATSEMDRSTTGISTTDEFDESDIWGLPIEPRPVDFRKPIPSSRISRKKPEKPDRTPASSLPVNIPDWSKILREEYRGNCRYGSMGGVEEDEEEDENEGGLGAVIPPHELLWRNRAASFSMQEGIGRTLKGRDLSRVRNAIWEKTGFQD